MQIHSGRTYIHPRKTSEATELLEVKQKSSVYDDQEEETMKQQKPPRTSDNEIIKDYKMTILACLMK